MVRLNSNDQLSNERGRCTMKLHDISFKEWINGWMDGRTNEWMNRWLRIYKIFTNGPFSTNQMFTFSMTILIRKIVETWSNKRSTLLVFYNSAVQCCAFLWSTPLPPLIKSAPSTSPTQTLFSLIPFWFVRHSRITHRIWRS